MGQIEHIKITNTAETLLSFSVNSASGIQASGEIGLRTWINGSSALVMSGDMPIMNPNGIATITAAAKPTSTLQIEYPS